MAVVLITGASRGIGAHLAEVLAASGHTVFAGMRSPKGSIALHGEPGSGAIHELQLDVTKPEQIDAAAKRVRGEAGRLDLLINNAGVAWLSPFELQSDDMLRETMETNFFGPLAVTRALLPLMREGEGGKVVFVSSLAAAHGLPAETAYCASKSALEAAAQSLALEAGRFGISVSVLRPGYTATGMATSDREDAMPENTAYEPLVQHLETAYQHAADDAESPELISEAVLEILKVEAPDPVYSVGLLAPTVDELRKADPREQAAVVAEFNDMTWWIEGLERPGSGESSGEVAS